MSRRAEIIPLSQSAIDKNWRALLGDALTRPNVRGAVIAVFYKDKTHNVGWSGVVQSDLAIAGARLLKQSVSE